MIRDVPGCLQAADSEVCYCFVIFVVLLKCSDGILDAFVVPPVGHHGLDIVNDYFCICWGGLGVTARMSPRGHECNVDAFGCLCEYLSEPFRLFGISVVYFSDAL